MEYVDILTPPTFVKSGVTKPIHEAWAAEDWIGTFNLWIIQRNPVPAIVYQVRDPRSSWAPGKLDVTAGGHYSAGEELYDGLREVKEELGKMYTFDQLTYIGRKMHVSPDTNGHTRKNIVDISFLIDDAPLSTYELQEEEVYAVAALPIEELLKVHTEDGYNFANNARTVNNESITLQITKDSFPHNWDNYHFKIALLAERFLRGEKNLLY